MTKATARSIQHSVPLPPDVKKWLKKRASLHYDGSIPKEVLKILREEKERDTRKL